MDKLQTHSAGHYAEQRLLQLELKSQVSQLIEIMNRDQDWGGKTAEQLGAVYQKLSKQTLQKSAAIEKFEQPINQLEVTKNMAFEIDSRHQIARLSLSQRQFCSRCEAGRRSRVWRFGPFGLRAESNTRCSRHGPAQMWSYTVVAKLGTYLSKSLEFTLGGLWGTGEWSMGPAVRLRNTLKRSESPLFQAFDRLANSNCWDMTYKNNFSRVLGIGKMDMELIRSEIRGLVDCLRREANTGRLRDCDEWGNTFLFVSAYLNKKSYSPILR
jgi:hypothetical protein